MLKYSCYPIPCIVIFWHRICRACTLMHTNLLWGTVIFVHGQVPYLFVSVRLALKGKVLDPCYETIKWAYTSYCKASLGTADHYEVHIVSVYRPTLKRESHGVVQGKVQSLWSHELWVSRHGIILLHSLESNSTCGRLKLKSCAHDNQSMNPHVNQTFDWFWIQPQIFPLLFYINMVLNLFAGSSTP